MSDYSWIKPGVKAVVVWAEHLPNAVGEVVTIESEPQEIEFSKGIYLGVRVREGFELVEKYNAQNLTLRFTPKASQLAPYKDESKELVSWESIAKDIGVDIRRLETV